MQQVRTIPTFVASDSMEKDLKVYKVSRTLPRKNAKRRLFARILATSKDEAIEMFMTECIADDGSRYTLHTGDWKEEIITNS